MKFLIGISAFLVLSLTVNAAPMGLDKRRFGQEHTPQADATFQEIKDIAQGTGKEGPAGDLSGAMVRALLAKAPACDQQDRADEIIDLGQQIGGDKEQQMIKLAQTYRQLERNTPNAGQPSELCNKPPKHKELDGLTQAQDPTGKNGNTNTTSVDNVSNNGNDVNKDNNGEKGKDCKGKDKGKGKGKSKCKGKGKGKGKDKGKGKGKGKKCKGKKEKKGKGKKCKGKKDLEMKKRQNNTDQNTAETNPVGGVKMPKIEQQNGEFIVNGDKFVNVDAAHGRQCDVQHNLCFNKFNSGDKSFSGQDCDNQDTTCKAGPPVFA